jgi:hypothetical protein
MKKTILLTFLALGVSAFAASNTFKVTIYQDSIVEGKNVKAGDYKVSVENGNAVLKQGKDSIAVPAREETEPNKVSSTELLYENNTHLQSIRVGGTHTRIVFENPAAMHPGA